MLFTLTAWLLRLRSNIWTIYNITQILLGNSVSISPQGIAEKMFFMLLIHACATFSVDFLDMLIQINFHEEEYIDFETLEDVVNANITICASQWDDYLIRNTYCNYNPRLVARLMRLLRPGCIYDSFIRNEGESALADNPIVAKAVTDHLGKGNRWIISLVREPFMTGWSSLLFTKTSPYVDRFNQILRRLSESGVIKRWFDNATKLVEDAFRMRYNDIAEEKELYLTKIAISNMTDTWFCKNMILLLLIAYSLFCFIFLCEIICRRVVIKFWKFVNEVNTQR